jgi:hypothetical protein
MTSVFLATRRADDRRAAVRDDVREVVSGQPVVDGDEDRSDLRHSVERLELGMRVRRDVSDAVAGLHAQLLKGERPSIAAIEELPVREALRSIDHGLAVRKEYPSAAHELEWRERRFPPVFSLEPSLEALAPWRQ